MLNIWIDKRREALVTEQTSWAAAWTIGIGNVLKQRRRNRADPVRGNDIARERLARLRVVNWNKVATVIHKVAEISGLLQHRRHGGNVRILIILLVPLLAVVAEGLVAAVVDAGNSDRPPNAEAVIVLVI